MRIVFLLRSTKCFVDVINTVGNIAILYLVASPLVTSENFLEDRGVIRGLCSQLSIENFHGNSATFRRCTEF